MERMKGLHAQHLGLVIDNRMIAPPSQFALAFVGVESQESLEQILTAVVREVKSERVDPSETPMLAHYAKEEDFSLDTLRAMATAKTGSQKIINQIALSERNAQGNLLTLSKHLLLSATEESRRWRTEQQPYEVTIYNPFSLKEMEFRGGTTFSDKTLVRGQHWGYGSEHEARFLNQLSPAARGQFSTKMEVMDYARAVALTGLDKLIRTGKVHLVGGSYDGRMPRVPLPFDFSGKGKRFAVEAFLLRYAPKSVIREVLEHERGELTLAEIDERLLGRKGFVTRYTTKGMADGYITKGVILRDKDTKDYAWALIQAFEERLFADGMVFRGYSLEFTENPGRRTVSIVFDGTATSKGGEDISARIVYDENSKQPYLLYKHFNSSSKEKWKPLGRDPWLMVNLGTDRQDYAKYRTKKWVEAEDWRTGREALCTLREPTQEMFDRASELSHNLGPGRTSSHFRGRYIQAMRERKAA